MCAQSCSTLCSSWIVAFQAPQSMELSEQEYWSGWPFPPPEDLPDPRIKPASLWSPALAGRFFTTSATSEAQGMGCGGQKWKSSKTTADGHIKEIGANLKVELVGLEDELVMEYERKRFNEDTKDFIWENARIKLPFTKKRRITGGEGRKRVWRDAQAWGLRHVKFRMSCEHPRFSA